MTAVAAAGVWKFYGDFAALRDVSLTVESGQCLALLGRNGAGKTTLLRILAGFLEAARGSVSIHGETSRQESARKRIGVLGHGIGVYEDLSAEENLLLFGRLFDLADPPGAAAKWLDRVGLARVRSGLVREFSRGMRQRLAIARAFLHSPDLLLLDEPFTSLDDRAVAVLQSVLAEALSRGATIVMSTHQLREAMELATHVALLQQGKLIHYGERPVEMIGDPGWLYARYGES